MMYVCVCLRFVTGISKIFYDWRDSPFNLYARIVCACVHVFPQSCNCRQWMRKINVDFMFCRQWIEQTENKYRERERDSENWGETDTFRLFLFSSLYSMHGCLHCIVLYSLIFLVQFPFILPSSIHRA